MKKLSLKEKLTIELVNSDIKLIAIVNKLNTIELCTNDIDIILLCNLKNQIIIRCNYLLTIKNVRVKLNKTTALTQHSFTDVNNVIAIINNLKRGINK